MSLFNPPSVCRMVHYSNGGECLAAVMTEVNEGAGYINLEVWYPRGGSFSVGVEYTPGTGEGTWHWPERV